MKSLKAIFTSAAALFFDHRCVACGHEHGPLCSDCLAKSPPLQNICLRCGYPSGVSDTVITQCPQCRDKKFRFAAARSLFAYQAPWREVIQAVKFQSWHGLLKHINPHWVPFVRESLENFPFEASPTITFVPGQPSRQRDRSVLLSQQLAAQASAALSLPAPPLLLKTRETPAQMSLPVAERARNLRGAFSPLIESAPWPKEVVLIDDLITTGHTANECTRTLIKAGTRTVLVLSLARAILDKPWEQDP